MVYKVLAMKFDEKRVDWALNQWKSDLCINSSITVKSRIVCVGTWQGSDKHTMYQIAPQATILLLGSYENKGKNGILTFKQHQNVCHVRISKHYNSIFFNRCSFFAFEKFSFIPPLMN